MVKSTGASAGAARGHPPEQNGASSMLHMNLGSTKLMARLMSCALLAGPFFAAVAAHAVDQGTTQTPPVHHKTHRKALPPLVLPPLPPGPLSQVPMDQLPAAAPKITYQNGLLSISAQNATLGDILHEVHKLTGATIDVPPTGATERVVVQLGPGAPRDVLASLLNGTSYNYVVLGSASDPTSISSVTLTQRPSAGGAVQTAVNTPPPVQTATPFQQQPPLAATRMLQNMRHGPAFAQEQPRPGAAADADDDSSDDSDADDKDDDSDQAQPQAQPPGQILQPNPNQAENQDDGNQPNAGPKTPEQILQMIRDRQQPGALPPQQQPPQD